MIDLTSNKISHAMTPEEFSGVKNNLQGILSALNFMVKLSQEEVDALYKISDADKTFIRNCLTEMPNASSFVPAYFKAEEVQKDLTCGEQLLEVENALLDLYNNVRRNRMLANAEAYSGASIFYRLTNAASMAGDAGAKGIFQRMQAYHVNKKNGGRNSRKGTSTAVKTG